jgi:[ribosomal protein S5]-alanine N-acetyltransferase
MNLHFNIQIFEKFPVLQSERLIFRKFIKKDAPFLFKIRSNEQVMEFMDNISLKSVDEAKALIKSYNWEFKYKRGITWAILDKQTNTIIGSFSFWHMNLNHCRSEIGYSLLPDYWGKGFMTETFRILLEFGFQNMHLHSIEANVNPENQNSIKLLERIGFRKEAHFRENFFYKARFLDSAIYCLIESDERNYG